ncbi:MAG: dephospho-CoA kinase, partial [Flavobacterium sp.]
VILITAPEELRIERAMKRDNLSKKDILVRIKNQISDSKKKELSDFVVENINLNNTFLKIDEILKILAKL